MEDNFARKQTFWLEKETRNRYKRRKISCRNPCEGVRTILLLVILIGLCNACRLPMFSGKKGVSEQAALFWL